MKFLIASITTLTVLASVMAIEEHDTNGGNTEEDAASRYRRKVGQLRVGKTAMAYMKELLVTIADENYTPKDFQRNPASVWCFLDADVSNHRQRPIQSEEKCSSVSRFVFDWELDSSTYTEDFSLTNALFRPYMQVIRRRFQVEEPIAVGLSVMLHQFGLSDENPENYSTTYLRSVNVTTESSGWLELDITDTLRKIWPPKQETPFVELVLKMQVDCRDQKKVPITFINPAEIPLTQISRRERYLDLQPLLVISVDNDELKSRIEDEKQFNTLYSSPISNSRMKRDAEPKFESESCQLDNFTVNFFELKLEHITEPKQMNIQRCSGGCGHANIKLNRSIATNHAKLMASAHEYYQKVHDNDDMPANNNSTLPLSESAPRVPCCVPISYESVYLVVQLHNSVQLKLFPDFIATECGCR